MKKRFWSKVKKAGPNDCWLWTACKSPYGYGYFLVDGRKMLAHRVAFELAHNRSIEPGEKILHSCDNPSCVNPNHLREGTTSDNLKDSYLRNRRSVAGEKNPSCLLSVGDIRDIRSLKGYFFHKDIACLYGVSKGHIDAIMQKRVWTHIS